MKNMCRVELTNVKNIQIVSNIDANLYSLNELIKYFNYSIHKIINQYIFLQFILLTIEVSIIERWFLLRTKSSS